MFKLTCLCIFVTACINQGFARPPLFLEKIGESQTTLNDGSKELKTYYIAPQVKFTWVESLAFCRYFNMDLAELKPHETSSFLRMLENRSNFGHVFIGGTNMGQFYWYWMISGEIINFEGRWLSGEPSNSGGRENCLCIENRQGKVGFNDFDCYGEELSGVVCQDVKTTKRNGIDLRIGA